MKRRPWESVAGGRGGWQKQIFLWAKEKEKKVDESLDRVLTSSRRPRLDPPLFFITARKTWKKSCAICSFNFREIGERELGGCSCVSVLSELPFQLVGCVPVSARCVGQILLDKICVEFVWIYLSGQFSDSVEVEEFGEFAHCRDLLDICAERYTKGKNRYLVVPNQSGSIFEKKENNLQKFCVREMFPTNVKIDTGGCCTNSLKWYGGCSRRIGTFAGSSFRLPFERPFI